MKKITIISGKGGTGKTTIVANFAALAKNIVLADCDVDAPNMHLLLKPETQKCLIFKSGKLAVKDESKCIDCALCQKYCEFEAINNKFEVEEIRCEGCGVCVMMCPQKAFTLQEQITGNIYISKSKYGPMIHASLKAGAENSGKLVSEVKEIAEDIGIDKDKDLLLIDGSPGIGCPVIASLNRVDFALIVTEPTKSGLSDLSRIVDVAAHFNIKSMVLINKYDINKNISFEIKNFCQEKKIDLVGKIPYDELIIQSLRNCKLVVNYDQKSAVALAIKNAWELVLKNIK